jgi:tRNA pseudouridine38-40 synthase
MRFFIQLSYKGTAYHGWQVQPNANTIQQEINKALSTILNVKIEVMGAGRTDTGVHAKQMFAHFDCNKVFEAKILIQKLNSFLPSDIAIQAIFEVGTEVSSRFDAISRTYEYHIVQHKSPFATEAYYLHKKLDVDEMNRGADYMLGKQDFTSFSKVNTDTFTNYCEVALAHWEWDNNVLVFTIKADRFLRNMVRAIVGTLLEVGIAKISAEQVLDIIAAKDRCEAGTSAPAKGLFLAQVEYPKNIVS